MDQVMVGISLDNCRKVFVERDYSKGLGVRFETEMPTQLIGTVDPEVWRSIVGTINAEFAEAEKVGLNSLAETTLSLCSCYISRLFLRTQYQKQLERIRRYIDDQNQQTLIPAGLYLIDPMEKGLRTLEVNILPTNKSQSRFATAESRTTMHDRE